MQFLKGFPKFHISHSTPYFSRRDLFKLVRLVQVYHFVDYNLSKLKWSPWGKEEGEGIPPQFLESL